MRACTACAQQHTAHGRSAGGTHLPHTDALIRLPLSVGVILAHCIDGESDGSAAAGDATEDDDPS